MVSLKSQIFRQPTEREKEKQQHVGEGTCKISETSGEEGLSFYLVLAFSGL